VNGAIIILGSETSKGVRAPGSIRGNLVQGSLGCVELLGRSLLARTVDHVSRRGFESVSVIRHPPKSARIVPDGGLFFSPAEAWRRAEEDINSLKEKGAEAVLVLCLGAYVEFDPLQMLQFHLDERVALTRALDEQGSLDLWIADPNRIPPGRHLWDFLYNESEAFFPVQGYVNRLENGRDLRTLVTDGLTSRCHLRPKGFEVRPGIWMDSAAEVHKGARIVAPAFIGRGVKIADQCLITRGSSVESNSQVDYASVVEDSSILANTYVGIGLDLTHSIADGNFLLNVRHEVMLEISDPVVMRQLREGRVHGGVNHRSTTALNGGELAMSSAEDR
jgi:hypothetical protein